MGILRTQVVRVQRFGWKRIFPLMLILVIVGCAYLFIELADEVREGETQGFDEWILRSLRRPDAPGNSHWPGLAARGWAGRDSSGQSCCSTARRRDCRRIDATAAQVRDPLVDYWFNRRRFIGRFRVKHVIGRERPTVVPHLQDVTSPSFPSGHAMLAAVVYLTLGSLLMEVVEGRLAKTYCLACALFVTFIVGVSRIYLGVHYPTDVFAGWMAGLAWAIACWITAKYVQNGGIQRRDTIDTKTPAPFPR